MIKKYICKLIFLELKKEWVKNLTKRRQMIYEDQGDYNSASREGKIAYQCLNLIEDIFNL